MVGFFGTIGLVAGIMWAYCNTEVIISYLADHKDDAANWWKNRGQDKRYRVAAADVEADEEMQQGKGIELQDKEEDESSDGDDRMLFGDGFQTVILGWEGDSSSWRQYSDSDQTRHD